MEIALNCPQCAGEVGLDEDASVFSCQYCGSVLKPTGRDGVQSFFFPPKGTKEQVGKALLRAIEKKTARPFAIQAAYLAYAPYWRVRGLLFQYAFGRKYETGLYGGTSFDHFKKLRAIAYHRTFPAFKKRQFGVFSLGLRAEAMKMRPYNREKMGEDALILGRDVSLPQAVQTALKTSNPLAGAGDEKVDLLKTGLIGERYSLLYFPFFCFIGRSGADEPFLIVDALSHKTVKGAVTLSELRESSRSKAIPNRPLDFIPFKCPNCGWDLPFRPHSRIHLCRTCGRAWREAGGSFREVAYKVISSDPARKAEACRYLPFWRLTAAIQTPQRQYRSLKDFYELFPQPRVMDPEALSKRPIRFFIPAFRIRNAAAVDKFAAQLARTQPDLQPAEPRDFREIDAADVWLPASEALEMAEILLYSITPKRAKRTHLAVKDASLKLEGQSLLWVPFFEKGIYLREAATDFAIQKNCIELD